MRSPTIFKKTVADFSTPKVILAYFVPFLVVGGLLTVGVASNLPDDIASMPLGQQERLLFDQFAMLSYFWAVGLPLLAAGSVLSANTLAREAEKGTLKILLSKPVRRWEVVVGTFLAIVAYSMLLGTASLFLIGSIYYTFSGASAGAIGGSIFTLMPGNLLYALFVSIVAAAMGTGLAVLTRNRLRTALVGIVFAVAYFAFLPVRQFAGDNYEDFFLYVVDVSYHFGSVYVMIHEAVGSGFTPLTQNAIAIWTGVYDPKGPLTDPLLGGMPPSLERVDYLPEVASPLLLLVLSLGLLGFAIYRFERMDIS